MTAGDDAQLCRVFLCRFCRASALDLNENDLEGLSGLPSLREQSFENLKLLYFESEIYSEGDDERTDQSDICRH
jgi:hypothetical protein